MSNPIPLDIDLDSAVRYNAHKAKVLGWYRQIPEQAVKEYPCWEHDAVNGSDAEKERFALETLNFQYWFSKSPVDHDGKFGPRTWLEVQKHFAHIDNDDQFFVMDDLRVEIPQESLTCRLTTFETEYDLHPAGKFGRRENDEGEALSGKDAIKCLVLHWGGTTLPGLYRYLRHTDRSVSTHFGVGQNMVSQFLDLKHRAWHAGYVNDFSVGIDICQQPLPEYYEYYRNAGLNVEIVDNPTHRGKDRILTLDSETARNVRDLVFALCAALGLEPRAPRNHGTVSTSRAQDFTVMGHHHVKSTKWDIACWWRQIFDGTSLGIVD